MVVPKFKTNNSKGGNVLDGKSDKYKSVNAMIKDVSPAIVGVINANGLEDFYKVNHHPNLKKVLVLVSSIKSIIILLIL